MNNFSGTALPYNAVRRIIVADDHPVVVVGISKALSMEADFKVVATAQTVTELMALLEREPCDVILCDYSFDGDPAQDGLGLLEKLIRFYPDAKIVVLSSHDDMPTIKNIIRYQVHGFVRKNCEVQTVVRAIRTVCAGKRFVDPITAEQLLDYVFELTAGHTTAVALTAREIETMRWLRRGMNITQIAKLTHRSVKTVSSQKISAMRKMGARNDLELLAAMKYHLD
jgi:two-component system capsular synthesis response regulator RcsB